jgi:hypothetical protein
MIEAEAAEHILHQHIDEYSEVYVSGKATYRTRNEHIEHLRMFMNRFGIVTRQTGQALNDPAVGITEPDSKYLQGAEIP